jgi:hypothetical protein
VDAESETRRTRSSSFRSARAGPSHWSVAAAVAVVGALPDGLDLPTVPAAASLDETAPEADRATFALVPAEPLETFVVEDAAAAAVARADSAAAMRARPLARMRSSVRDQSIEDAPLDNGDEADDAEADEDACPDAIDAAKRDGEKSHEYDWSNCDASSVAADSIDGSGRQ